MGIYIPLLCGSSKVPLAVYYAYSLNGKDWQILPGLSITSKTYQIYERHALFDNLATLKINEIITEVV